MKRIQISLRQAIGLMLVASVLLGFWVRLWPHYKARSELEDAIRGGGIFSARYEDSDIGRYFQGMGEPGISAVMDGLDSTDQVKKISCISFSCGFWGLAAQRVAPKLYYMGRFDKDANVRTEAHAALFRVMERTSCWAFLDVVDKLSSPSLSDISEALARLIKEKGLDNCMLGNPIANDE